MYPTEYHHVMLERSTERRDVFYKNKEFEISLYGTKCFKNITYNIEDVTNVERNVLTRRILDDTI